MIPAFPMDGGRVLRAVLAMRMNYARATQVAATVGQGIAFIFFIIGLWSNPMLLLIAVFIYFGASSEAAFAQMPQSMLFDRAYALMQKCRCPALPVLDASEKVVGLFTPENVGEMIMVQSALSARAR